MVLFQKLKQSISEQRKAERTNAAVEKQAALLEYVAIMADVELPEDNAESEAVQYE